GYTNRLVSRWNPQLVLNVTHEPMVTMESNRAARSGTICARLISLIRYSASVSPRSAATRASRSRRRWSDAGMVTFGRDILGTACLLAWALPHGKPQPQNSLMKQDNPDGASRRPAKRLNAGVRRASNAARRGDRCQRHAS